MQITLVIRAEGPGLYGFTREVLRFVRDSDVAEGLLTLFVQHTSCSPLVQENADPDVRRDLDALFRRLVPSVGGKKRPFPTLRFASPFSPAPSKAAARALGSGLDRRNRRHHRVCP